MRFDESWIPEPNTGCWLWTRSTFGRGAGRYGRLKVPGRGSVKAHALAWELRHGPVPDGLCVLHKCDTPACVNPAHLSLGTIADNARDRQRKGRTRGIVPGLMARMVTVAGVTRSLTGWAREVGMDKTTIQRRLRNGWSLEQAVTLPPVLGAKLSDPRRAHTR